MCLAIPARLLSIDGDEAVADAGGARTRISVALLEDPQPGDWVVIHTGFALSRLDADAAEALTDMLAPLMEPAP
jgi:hydrogenase expression/formation protein HypC